MDLWRGQVLWGEMVRVQKLNSILLQIWRWWRHFQTGPYSGVFAWCYLNGFLCNSSNTLSFQFSFKADSSQTLGQEPKMAEIIIVLFSKISKLMKNCWFWKSVKVSENTILTSGAQTFLFGGPKHKCVSGPWATTQKYLGKRRNINKSNTLSPRFVQNDFCLCHCQTSAFWPRLFRNPSE